MVRSLRIRLALVGCSTAALAASCAVGDERALRAPSGSGLPEGVDSYGADGALATAATEARGYAFDDGEVAAGGVAAKALQNPARREASLHAARRLATGEELRTQAPALLVRPVGPEQQPLPLQAMRVSTVLRGTRARVLIDCTFHNPHPRQLEGTFLARLPDGASPASLAMYLGGPEGPIAPGALLPPRATPEQVLAQAIELPGRWSAGDEALEWGELRPGRVVEAVRGRVVYEQVTRPRVDPALMEWSGGNTFRTRIFPIPAGGLKRVFFAYDLAPRDVEGDSLVTLPVPAELPPAFRVEVAVERALYGAARLVHGETSEPLAAGADEPFLAGGLDLDAARAGADGFLLLAAPRERRTQAAYDRRPEVPGPVVHARVRPSAAVGPRAPTRRAVFLLDTSLSQRARLAASCGQLLGEVLARDETLERFRVIEFNVAARPLFDGWRRNDDAGRAQTRRQVEALWLEGATDLEAALDLLESTLAEEEGPPPLVFLLSDAQVTWGVDEVRELERTHPRAFAAPWVGYQVGDAAVNRPLIGRLTRSGGRLVTVLGAAAIPQAALAHRTAPTSLAGVRVEGVRARDLVVAGEPRSLYPGQVVEVAFRLGADEDPAAATLVLETGAGVQRFPLGEHLAGPDLLAGRAWAEHTAGSLLNLGAPDADQVALALSQAFGLVNRVASLLILEAAGEYEQHALRAEALDLEVLAAAAAAARSDLPAGAPDPAVLPAEARRLLKQLAGARTPAWARPDAPRGQGSPPRPERGEGPLDPTTVYRQAASRWAAGRPGEAVRVLSSVVEERPRDARALRLAGYVLMAWGQHEPAAALFGRARRLRPFEPQAALCEALALQALGRADQAALRYELVLQGQFDPRWTRFAQQDARWLYAGLLRALGRAGADSPASARLASLGLKDQPRVAHELHLFWNLDDADVDLHVIESGLFGDHVYYSDREGSGGGLLHWDNTAGLGPELYTHPEDEPARAYVHYFGSSSVAGTVPSATLLVHFDRSQAAARVRVGAAVLADRGKEIQLFPPALPSGS